MRGQIVLEFLLIASLAILVCLLYLGVSVSALRDASERQRIDALNDVGFSIQDEVILATQVSDGYERNFTIPSRADRFVYTLSSDANSVTLTSGAVTLVYDLPPVTGSFQKGANLLTKNGGVTVVPG